MAKQCAESSGLGSFLLGILAGMAGGTIVALLFAPKPGKTLRADLKRVAKETWEDLPENVRKSRSQYSRFIDRTRVGLENQVNRMDKAAKAGKLAAAKERENMDSGEAFSFN